MNQTSIFYRLGFIIQLLVFNTLPSVSQNLVPNPGFEILSSCPERLNSSPTLLAPPWVTPYYATNNGAFGTADIFHVCSNPSAVGVPKNVKGFQYPRTGNGYAGFISHGSGGSFPYSQREYLQVPLTAPLVSGNIYYVGFYINLPNRLCAIKEVGMHFSKGVVPPAGDNIFNYEPQLESSQGWLSDTSGWMLIDGCYIAEGDEDYITIGNFRTNMESSLNVPCHDLDGGYYYLDDVFVINMSDLDLGDDAGLCPGDSIILDAGSGSTEYVWHNMSTADSFLVTGPGVYYVEASNICGSSSDTIIVTLETDAPQIELPDMVTLCEGEKIILDPQVQGVQFAWSDGSQLPQLEITAPGDYALTVTNGCGTDIDNVTVVDGGAIPSVSLGSSISICPGEILEIQPIQEFATSWIWQDGSQLSSIMVSNPGIIHVTVFNDCGSASDTVEVVLNSNPPELDLGQDIQGCTGEIITLNANATGVSYLWQDGSTGAVLTTMEAGTYVLQISNACGSDMDTVLVTLMSPPPFPDLGNDTILCNGNILSLEWNGTEDVTLLWDNGFSFPFNFIEQSGLYHLTATNMCGTSYDEIEVEFINPPESFTLGNDTILCSGESITLYIPHNNGTITWQDGSHQNVMIANNSQTYSATINNQCGTQQDEISVTIDPRNPSYPFDLVKTVCSNETIVLDVTQDFEAEYLWSTGSVMSLIEINSIGNYSVIISTSCLSEPFEFEILPGVTCEEFQNIFIPSIFSPNGDGINDLLVIYGGPGVEEIAEFVIFDRWGNVVHAANSFQPNEAAHAWDGRYEGNELNPGVFAYRMIVDFGNGRQEIIYGDISLVR